jgi:ribosomal protein S18 acetylase RimI-like enzyme
METTDRYHITVEENPDPKDIQFVSENLSRDAENRTGLKKDYRKLGFFIRDHTGGIVGGLVVDIAWGWLYICTIWLEDGIRGRGFGRQLFEMAEKEAKKLGCRNSYLETFNFQARPFYEKLGYEVYGTLDDIPPGHRRYLMKKKLE